MTKQLASHVTTLALASDDSGAPEWVQLTPAGPEIVARDGRRFLLRDIPAIIAAFEANAADLPVDIEHATETRPKQGLDAPAVGWIKELQERAGAIWGRVEWTEQGRDWVTSKAYRYLSPAFYHLKGGEMIALKSAGITNTPAFKMTALASVENPPKEIHMDKAVLDALNLGADATAADAVAAIATLQGNLQTATARAETPDPNLFVAKAQYDATAAKLAQLQAEQAAAAETALASAVDAGIEAGKIAPAARDMFLATASAVGLDAFNTQLDAMPVIATAAGDDPDLDTSTASLSTEELAVAAALDMTAEEFAAAKK